MRDWNICAGCGRVLRSCKVTRDGDLCCRSCRSEVLSWLHSQRWYWLIVNAIGAVLHAR